VAAWVELALLRHALGGRIGAGRAGMGHLVKLWLAAGGAAAVALTVKGILPAALHPVGVGAVVLGLYGVLYFGLAAAAGVDDAARLLRRARRFR
jgi:putative peptidoglycan lipid II flippase